VYLLLCPDKYGMQVSLCSVSLNVGAIFFLNRSFYAAAPKFGDRLIVIIEPGGIAEAVFGAIDGMINSITKT